MTSRTLATSLNQKATLANMRSFWENYRLPISLLILHAPAGVLLLKSSSLAAIHAFAVLCFGLYWATKRLKTLEQVSLIIAYIAGAEVLWRMANAPIFWEFGKYSVGLIMVTALVVRNKWKIPSLPLAYLILLLPGCLLTILSFDLSEAKNKLSFNMSGPLLLFISCWFFSQIKVNWMQLRKILFWLIIPLTTIGITTLFHTVTNENLRFSDDSNYGTSGGFGPNQVSAILGLGVFISIASYLLFKNRLKEKYLFGILTIFLAAQSILTFSRSGIYNAAGAILTVLLFQMRNAGKGFKQIVSVAVIALIFMIAIFPQMNNFTGGALQNRFKDTNTTGRSDIAKVDLMIFADNPVWGVGVGESFEYHERYFGKEVAAHTEFSRLIAEHGIFGIFSILLMVAMAFSVVKWQKTALGKAIAGGFVIWSTLFMFNTGMRLVAPSFIWGLSYIIIANIQQRSPRYRPKDKNEFKFRTK